MKHSFSIVLIFSALAIAASAPTPAQSPAANQNQPDKKTPATTTQQPKDSNAFPEDTANIPVMTNKATPTATASSDNTADLPSSTDTAAPSEDNDPIRSPEGVAATLPKGQDDDSSSSSSAIDKILPRDDDPDQPDGKRKGRTSKPEKVHVETAAEDISVGQYYLDGKNWNAARSRFESALVLSPEEPEVYWGLAESERNLGNLDKAKAHYAKVVEYDPDSKHGKAAAKILKTTQFANLKPTP